MEKIFFFDLETTGVDIKKSAIYQLSYIVDLNGEPVETGSIKMAPHPGADISKEALEVGGVTLEQISAYQPPIKAYQELISVLAKYVDKFNRADKFTLCGFNNVKFDNDFLRTFFERLGDAYFGSWFFSSSYDCMVMSAFIVGLKRNKMQDFKLKTVCVELGIEVDHSKLHDASYDIGITRELFYRVKSIMSAGVSKKVSRGGSLDWVFFGDGRYSVIFNKLLVASVLSCGVRFYVDLRNISEESEVVMTQKEADAYIWGAIDAWYGSVAH